MYILPGFIKIITNENAVRISSQVKQNTLLLTDDKYIKEFQEIQKLGGCEVLNTTLKTTLHNQEMLLTEKELIRLLNEVKSLLDKTMMITIMPTEACNFRCPYCYESHEPRLMSKQTMSIIEKYIAERIENFETLEINWFGGEPTLCIDTIADFSNFIYSLQQKYKFKYISNITTNGYLLNQENFIRCYNSGIRTYQITIDGFNHDKTRPLANGGKSLETIIQNIKAIHCLDNKTYNFKVIIRHNILSNDNDLSWYDYLSHILGNDMRFGVVVRAVTDWGGDKVKTLKLLKDEKERNLQIHKEYIERIGLSMDEGDNQLFGRICYAAYPNGYIFRADGSIMKCSVALNDEINRVGKIIDNKVKINNTVNDLWCRNSYDYKCYRCKNILSCLNLSCRYNSIKNKELTCLE